MARQEKACSLSKIQEPGSFKEKAFKQQQQLKWKNTETVDGEKSQRQSNFSSPVILNNNQCQHQEKDFKSGQGYSAKQNFRKDRSSFRGESDAYEMDVAPMSRSCKCP